MPINPIAIVSIARTPIGNMLGELKEFSGHKLGSFAIEAAIKRANLQASDIHEVYMGCVLPAGQGQAPARQAALHAGISSATPCTTISKVCGSGMKAIMIGYNSLLENETDIIVAGGMESMTNAPYLLLKGRQGYRFGKSELYDHMTLDGLEDAYDKGQSMGVFAEKCVQQYQFTREEQDAFAAESFNRARYATEHYLFNAEIVPISVKTKQGEIVIDKDEHPFSVNPEKIPQLPAAFLKDGSVTAGNSSSIADGAAALVMMRSDEAKKRGIERFATIVGTATFAKAPSEFTTAPIDAVKKLLKKINWTIADVDLFEVNEAFAAVALAFMRDLNVPHAKLNIHGGGIALGHPIGATGARIVVSLIAAMQARNVKRGIAALCIGGGEATAIAIEIE